MIKLSKIFLMLFFINLSISLLEDEEEQRFQKFEKEYKKNYKSKKERNFRKMVFRENSDKIDKHNKKKDSSYKLRINQFGDLTTEEVKASFLIEMDLFKNMPTEEDTGSNPRILEDTNNNLFPDPNNVDWRNIPGAVNPIKNQKQCGSCYAFSAAAAAENAIFRKQNKSVSLSEQQIVSCTDASYNASGCNGGYPRGALKYIAENGVVSSNDFNYTGTEAPCPENINTAYEKHSFNNISSFSITNKDTGPEMIESMLRNGVVSAALYVNTNMYYYSDGIFREDDEACAPVGGVNHAINIVGYHRDDQNPENSYFIIRNSWNTTWGIDGYMHIAYDTKFQTEKGQCNLFLWDIEMPDY